MIPSQLTNFYRADPAAYFDIRWCQLMHLNRDDELDNLSRSIREGFRVMGVNVRDPMFGPNPDEVAAYTLIDAYNLLFHVSETLLRLFDAHAIAPLDANLELERGRFKQKYLEKLGKELQKPVWEQARLNSVAEVFFCAGDGWAQDSELRSNVQAVQRLLQVLAEVVTDDHLLHNSLKHGLGVSADETYIGFVSGESAESSPSLSQSSLAFRYLISEKRKEPNEVVWSEVTSWRTAARALLLSHFGIRQMQTLWTVAKIRVGILDIADAEALWVINESALDDVRDGTFRERGPFRDFSVVIAREPMNRGT